MKKQTKWVVPILLIACVAVFIGGILLFNEIFPEAPPIHLPASEHVVAVSVYCDHSDATIQMNVQDWDKVMGCIGDAKPTRQQSANDHPDIGDYFKIVIQTADMSYSYFAYESNQQTYIEIPYTGIYNVDAELLHVVSMCFEES